MDHNVFLSAIHMLDPLIVIREVSTQIEVSIIISPLSLLALLALYSKTWQTSPRPPPRTLIPTSLHTRAYYWRWHIGQFIYNLVLWTLNISCCILVLPMYEYAHSTMLIMFNITVTMMHSQLFGIQIRMA